MKKFLTILSAATALTCALAFTACGGGDGDKAAVTESEWKTALSYFKADTDKNFMPVASDYPRVSFSCKTTTAYTYDDEEGSEVYILTEDFSKKAASLEFTVGEQAGDCYYMWKDGDGCYSVGDGWERDGDTGEVITFYSKEAISEDELALGFDGNILFYAGGEHISALDLAEKYSEFTYSAENGEYTASFDYEQYEGVCDITLKFNNGKLSVMSVKIDSGEYGVYDNTYEYTYGVSVTVPEFFLNMELGETEKPE